MYIYIVISKAALVYWGIEGRNAVVVVVVVVVVYSHYWGLFSTQKHQGKERSSIGGGGGVVSSEGSLVYWGIVGLNAVAVMVVVVIARSFLQKSSEFEHKVP